jgi:hypothetical protein
VRAIDVAITIQPQSMGTYRIGKVLGNFNWYGLVIVTGR